MISSPLGLAQGVGLVGLGSPLSPNLRIIASASFPLDQPLLRNKSGEVLEGVLIENLLFDGGGRSDGIWFNGVRSSMMKNVTVMNVLRPNNYGFRFLTYGKADVSACYFYGLRAISTWGGIEIASNDASHPVIDNGFFGVRLQVTERGIYIHATPYYAVQREMFSSVMIDTNSPTAVGIEDGCAYNTFVGVALENTTRTGIGLKQTGGGSVYLNFIINYPTSTVSQLSTLSEGAEFQHVHINELLLSRQTSDLPAATTDTSMLFSRPNGEIVIRNGTGNARELQTKSEVAGISGTTTLANNLRGSLWISDTATQGAVKFERAEPDSNYFVVASVGDIAGKPAIGSTRLYVTAKTSSGFQLNAEAPPGAGNKVKADWILIR